MRCARRLGRAVVPGDSGDDAAAAAAVQRSLRRGAGGDPGGGPGEAAGGAHDDDARRAVHAGLGLLEAMPALPTRLAQDKGIRLALRVGMHTGLTVVGEIGGGQPAPLALGDTPHVAAWLQRYAAPDTVVISE